MLVAEAAAEEAQLYNQGPLLDRAVVVVPDTTITYDTFSAGDIVRLRAQPWAYELKPAVASEYDLLTTGGAKLDLTDRSQWGAWGAPADAAIEHNPNGANIYLGYVVTGTDCAATLQKAINRAIADNVGALELPPGAWLVDADIDLTGPENTNFAGQMFGLHGAGISHPSWIQYGLGRRQRSVLLLKAGRKIIKGRPGQSIRDLTIIGKVESGVLLDLVEASTTGGGLDHVAVVNNIPSAPVGSPVAVRVTGLWMGGLDHVEIMGRRDYRAAWDDNSITGDNLFFGTGLFVDVRTQGGSTGGPEKATAAGCAIGLRIAAPEQQIWYSLDSTTFQDWQSQYCQVGALIERGASVVTFDSPHFEYCADADLIVRNGAGHVSVRNGKSALTLRGSEYRKYGSMVCGSPVSGENKFKSLHVEGFTFETLENGKCAVRYYGGATEAPGLLILEDCCFAGGGIAVLVDTTLGSICDIWIKGSKPHP
ncbi:hypothetical protein MASR1M32_10760 [Rhodobacter sp.]